MQTGENRIGHVSDTALMVAACRARETARADAMIRDPFAAQLAGERGATIAANIPHIEWMGFGIGVRCRFLDDLIARTIAQGIGTVLSLGAGLDTRPWRLDLPAELRWIEVDFPAMLEYKAARMAAERPKCRIEQIPADLTNPAQREAVFRAAGSGPGLMVTEGLLMYLPAATVDALASEPVALSGIRRWLLDIASGELQQVMHRDIPDVEAVRAEGHLEGEAILERAERNGWRGIERRTYIRDAAAVAGARMAAMAAAGAGAAQGAVRPDENDPSGVHLMGHE